MKLFVFFIFLIPVHIIGQNYVLYQQIFNRIDEDIIQNKYESALVRLDSIYQNYDFIYAKHCIKALQICCSVDDSINADKWLEKSFKQGVPIWIIQTNELTKRALLYSTTRNTIQNKDSLYTVYKMSINLNLADQIDSLFVIDQRYTKKVNDGFILFRHTLYGLKWIINNKKQFKVINDIINEYGFPGERLIGIDRCYKDSIAIAKQINFLGPDLSEVKAYFMLLHYFSNLRKINNDFENKLFQNVTNGYIPPYQFGRIIDYIYRFNRKKKSAEKRFYYVNARANKDSDEEINSRRNIIGLNSMEQQERNDLINRKNRGNKKNNSEILLE